MAVVDVARGSVFPVTVFSTVSRDATVSFLACLCRVHPVVLDGRDKVIYAAIVNSCGFVDWSNI